MESEIKTHSTSSVQACQNCKQDFVIEPDDFAFYEKMKVPSPRFARNLKHPMPQTVRKLFTVKAATIAR